MLVSKTKLPDVASAGVKNCGEKGCGCAAIHGLIGPLHEEGSLQPACMAQHPIERNNREASSALAMETLPGKKRTNSRSFLFPPSNFEKSWDGPGDLYSR